MTSRATIFCNFVRYMSFSKRKIRWKDPETNQLEGRKYGLITYFPRHPNEVDPAFEPSKLFLVKQVKSFWGNPWWDKNTLKQLGFNEEKRTSVIVKNTPTMCALLWKVKHLVKVTPIKLPDKLPSTDDDLNATYLHENGTFTFIPKVDPVRLEIRNEFWKNPKRLDRQHIEDKLRSQWLNGHM